MAPPRPSGCPVGNRTGSSESPPLIGCPTRHHPLPSGCQGRGEWRGRWIKWGLPRGQVSVDPRSSSCPARVGACRRSEEHTSELQSRENLVCRLLLEKKKKKKKKELLQKKKKKKHVAEVIRNIR